MIADCRAYQVVNIDLSGCVLILYRICHVVDIGIAENNVACAIGLNQNVAVAGCGQAHLSGADNIASPYIVGQHVACS